MSAMIGVVAPLGADIGRLQQRPQSMERRHQFGLRIHAHHAPAARQFERLDDARERETVAERGGVGGNGDGDKRRNGQTGIAQPFATAQLVASDHGRARRMARQPEPFENARGDDRRPIADRKHAVDRARDRRVQDRRRRSELVVEPNRHAPGRARGRRARCSDRSRRRDRRRAARPPRRTRASGIPVVVASSRTRGIRQTLSYQAHQLSGSRLRAYGLGLERLKAELKADL